MGLIGRLLGRQQQFDAQSAAGVSQEPTHGPAGRPVARAETSHALAFLRSQNRHAAASDRHADPTNRTNFRSTIAPLVEARFGNDPRADGDFAEGGALHDENRARRKIISLFPNTSKSDSSATMLLAQRLMQFKGGSASRYGNSMTLAYVLRQATGGDASRALAVVNAWRNDTTLAGGQLGADMLATQCALSQSDQGWQLLLEKPHMLTAMSPDGQLAGLETDAARANARLAFTASEHLLRNYVDQLGLPRPTTLDESIGLARHIVGQANAPEEQAALTGIPANVFRYHRIAADALLGAVSPEPTLSQCEAIVFLRGGTIDPDHVAETSTRFDRIVGRSGHRESFLKRMRSSEELSALDEPQIIKLLVMNVIDGVCKDLEPLVNAPYDGMQGNAPIGKTRLRDQFETRVQNAARLATLMVMGDRIARKGWRDEMPTGTLARRKIREQTAQLLGMKEKELAKDPVWADYPAQLEQLDLATLRKWATDAQPGFEGSALENRLNLLSDLDRGAAPRIAGLKELVTIVEEGSSIDVRSSRVKGFNNTLWFNAALALSGVVSHAIPTITALPTRAHTRGRGGRIAMNGSEGPDGACLEIHAGTFERDTRIRHRGVVMQSNVPIAFAWLVHEWGTHEVNQTFRGPVIRIEVKAPDGLDKCKEIAAGLFDGLSDNKDGATQGLWNGWVKAAAKHPSVSVRYDEGHTSAPTDVNQNMAIAGVTLPFLHLPQLTLPFASIKFGPWLAGAVQRHRSVMHGGEVHVNSAGTTLVDGAYEHVTTVPAGLAYPPPSVVLPTVAGVNLSGGHGAMFTAFNSKRTTNVIMLKNGSIHIPAPGVSGSAPTRQWTTDVDTCREWLADRDGASTPRPPAGLTVTAPDKLKSARGQQEMVVRQHMKPEARKRLDELQTLAAHIASSTGDERELNEIGDNIGQLLMDEGNWEEPDVLAQQKEHSQKASGPLPWGYQWQILEESTLLSQEPLGWTDPTASKFPSTPKELYPGLFEAVQMGEIFEDSKTFVDLVPGGDSTPADIMTAYHARRDLPDFELSEFVEDHFEIVEAAGRNYRPDPSMPIMDHINRMWDVLTLMPTTTINEFSSLLPMKHPHVVPSPRFSETYYWDTYFTIRGLLASARRLTGKGDAERANALIDLAAGMVQNIADQIDAYGFAPNGGRSYYRDRSQLPYFTLMVRELSEVDPSASARYMPQMLKEDAFWDDGIEALQPGQAHRRVVKLQDGTIQYRHWSDEDDPRQESHAEDVKTALAGAANGLDPDKVQRGLRAGAESGQDYSPARWSADGESLEELRVTEMASVSLTSLRAACIRHIAETAVRTGDRAMASEYNKRAAGIEKGIRKYMWDPEQKVFMDYLWLKGRRTGVIHSQSMYALLANAATRRQGRQNLRTVEERLVNEHGISTTDFGNEEEQWDLAIWAPEQIVAMLGAANYDKLGARGPARRLMKKVARGGTGTIERNYGKTGEIEEKYTRDGEISEAGEYSGLAKKPEAEQEITLEKEAELDAPPNRQTGFAWTNSAYVELRDFADASPESRMAKLAGPLRQAVGRRTENSQNPGRAGSPAGESAQPRPYGRRFG
ncbi:neutral trehalase [Paraburkholderia terricola]|uniref:trehalase family glycosidase n=1 Tax=Paraburkholderia terricola TaxID=169427 RepID=UPI00285E2C4C|nr:trehalase family glycosidase [Paraburkholderia terricola]MDR6450178.1 neutral trehalase [Paraburkholderia terricola]